MRGEDKHGAKNIPPHPMSFSSIGIEDVCGNKAVSLLLLFHYSLSFCVQNLQWTPGGGKSSSEFLAT